MITDAGVMLSLKVLYFVFGYLFFKYTLFQDFQIRNRSFPILFALTFTLSCSLFTLIILEIMDVLDGKSREILLRLDVALLLTLLIFVLPLYIIYLTLSRVFQSVLQLLVLTALGFAGFLYGFFQVNRPSVPIHIYSQVQTLRAAAR